MSEYLQRYPEETPTQLAARITRDHGIKVTNQQVSTHKSLLRARAKAAANGHGQPTLQSLGAPAPTSVVEDCRLLKELNGHLGKDRVRDLLGLIQPVGSWRSHWRHKRKEEKDFGRSPRKSPSGQHYAKALGEPMIIADSILARRPA